MGKFVKFFDRMENLLMALAFMAITIMMLLISADALGRYLFKTPIAGSNEIITIYLIVAVIYLGLSNTLKENEHISVDILVNKFPNNLKKYLSVIVNLLGLLIFVFIFYQGSIVTYNAFVTNENFVGAVTFPLYAAYGLVPLGSLFIIIRFLINILIIKGYEKSSLS